MEAKLKMKQTIHINPKSDDKMAIITGEVQKKMKQNGRLFRVRSIQIERKKSETTTKQGMSLPEVFG